MTYLNKDPNKVLTVCDFSVKHTFDVEWFDYESSMYRHFWLRFYPADGGIDLYDKKFKKSFLHRTFVPGITLNMLYIGNTINILGRLFRVVNYASDFTKQHMRHHRQVTLALIKPGTTAKFGDILKCIANCKLQVTRVRMCAMTQAEVLEFFQDLRSEAYITPMVATMTSGPVIALELVGENAINEWKQVIGPSDPVEARRLAPTSLRAAYGYEVSNNGFHGSCSEDDVQREIDFFFPIEDRKPPKLTAKYDNSTLCIIKPHVIMDGTFGDIICEITKTGFEITGMFSVHVSLVNADEFMEIYKGVLEHYAETILHLSSGNCVALEISHPDSNVDCFSEFRRFCGPYDPEIARQIRPNSIRAKFGLNQIYNAVHCTDLEDDRQSDMEYFFRILDDAK